MKPKAKVPMTELMREIAESSMSPRCPTKMLVIEFVPYWHHMLKTIGSAMSHILLLSIQNTSLTFLNPLAATQSPSSATSAAPSPFTSRGASIAITKHVYTSYSTSNSAQNEKFSVAYVPRSQTRELTLILHAELTRNCQISMRRVYYHQCNFGFARS